MAVAVTLAVVIVVLVGLIAWIVVARTGPTRTQPPSDGGTVTELPSSRSGGRGPKEAEAPSVVEEAEAILKAEEGESGEAPTEEAPTEEAPPEGEGAGEQPPATGVGTLEREARVEEVEAEEVVKERPTFRQRLGRTRQALADRLADVRLRRKIDDNVWDDLEEALVLADVGVDLSAELMNEARSIAGEAKAATSDDVVGALKDALCRRLHGRDRGLTRKTDGPTVWLIVGVNGTGKTTTIGKIASEHVTDGEHVVLAAADTFRAAAADQLEVWADRAGAELIRGQEGADPGSVVFDAVSFCRARDCDLLVVDTAGRLHTKVNLMEELKKIQRVATSAGGEPDEVLLIIDATTGQNGLVQAREFASATGVSGVVLTKLDGTAKGGIAFAIEQQFEIPIKLVGLGESAEDLVPFDPDEFVDALFD